MRNRLQRFQMQPVCKQPQQRIAPFGNVFARLAYPDPLAVFQPISGNIARLLRQSRRQRLRIIKNHHDCP